jgi:hypothetical protein
VVATVLESVHAEQVSRREEDDLAEDLGGDLGAALLPFVGGTVGKRFAGAIATEWQRKRSNALRAAECASGLSREDFAEWVEREPRAIPLYLKVLWAAGMNGHDKTLAAMGLVLGRAATATASADGDAFEQAELALSAMDELRPPHFKILDVLVEAIVSVDESGAETRHPTASPDIAVAAGLDEGRTLQCLTNLTGAGLASMHSGYGMLVYRATDLGDAVVEAARAAGER